MRSSEPAAHLLLAGLFRFPRQLERVSEKVLATAQLQVEDSITFLRQVRLAVVWFSAAFASVALLPSSWIVARIDPEPDHRVQGPSLWLPPPQADSNAMAPHRPPVCAWLVQSRSARCGYPSGPAQPLSIKRVPEVHDSPTLERLTMSPSSRQKKRGTRSGQTPAHKHPQVVHGQPGASTGQRQFTNQADQAPQEHADRSTGEQPERSGRGAGHGSSHERAQKKLAGILKNFFERAGYEREEKELARAHKNFFERAGYEAELEPLVGERRVDLRLSIEGRDQFFVFKIVDLVNLVWPETDECDRFNASVEQILDQDQIDRRLTDVENELYQEYRGVPNFTPMVFGMPNSEPFVIGISGRAGTL